LCVFFGVGVESREIDYRQLKEKRKEEKKQHRKQQGKKMEFLCTNVSSFYGLLLKTQHKTIWKHEISKGK